MNKANFRKLNHDVNALHEKVAKALGIKEELLAIIKGEQPKEEKPDSKPDVAALLSKARFDSTAPPAPVPLYSLAGNTIATAENVMVVQAKMKAGKSAAIGAMIAATMEPTGDCLWFSSANPSRHAVLHFDTEQSKFDHYQLITRSLRRAGRTAVPPWLYSYHIKGYSISVMLEMVKAALELAAAETGGVHSCIIDGIGDLCADVNDAAEANALVAEMEALAMKYRTLIVCVLHENHGSDSGKTRGHLGSQLARKAETNLRLEKDSEGVTIMFADTSRSVHITKKQAPGFRWCDEAKCHVSEITSVAAMRTSQEAAEMQELAGHCFQNSGGVGLGAQQLVVEIINALGVKERKAYLLISQMLKAMVIRKNDGRYFRN